MVHLILRNMHPHGRVAMVAFTRIVWCAASCASPHIDGARVTVAPALDSFFHTAAAVEDGVG